MGGTTRSTHVSVSLLAVEEDEDREEDEVDGEDKGAGGGVLRWLNNRFFLCFIWRPNGGIGGRTTCSRSLP